MILMNVFLQNPRSILKEITDNKSNSGCIKIWKIHFLVH